MLHLSITRCFLVIIYLLVPITYAAVCDSDVNRDGIIDELDLLTTRMAWRTDCTNCPEDVDRDGSISLLDILTVKQAQWGTTCVPPIEMELAGNSLNDYPFFEYVRAFNDGSTVEIGIDPNQHSQILNQTADIYVVEARTPEEWADTANLVDATSDGMQTVTFSGTTIQENTFTISGSTTLSSEAGMGLGHAYDIVVDMNRNGDLDGGDLIDGLKTEFNGLISHHGFYMVHDLTQTGPLNVTEVEYSAVTGTVTAGFEAENIFYPTDIASRGILPLIIVSHGNGHDYSWYDHVGTHMASYGYVVMSHANNTVPGVFSASTTTLEHTDAFLSQLAQIDGGVLNGHIDVSRMTWLGHSRGGEGVAIAIDRIVDGDWVPVNYSLDDIMLVSSIAPVDFLEGDQTDPHGVNYHLWTGGSDDDVNGCADCNLCQTFHLHDRATGYRQSISLHGVGHGDFHNGGGSSVATGPCLVGRADTHLIMKGYLLPLVKYYVEANVPAQDYLWRQWEHFKPVGAPTSNCVVVDLMYRDDPETGYTTVDDYQTQVDIATSSSGGAVTFSVNNLAEGLLDDNNLAFTHDEGDPMNGMTVGGSGDDSKGVVFDFTSDSFYELELLPDLQDLTQREYLQFRACQATHHPETNAEAGDLSFTVTLKDIAGHSSSIRINAYGGGIEEPYQRFGCGTGEGWANEFETIRIRITDFTRNQSLLDLTQVAAVRFEFGPSFGSSSGRLGMDDIAMTNNKSPKPGGTLAIGVQGSIPILIAPGTPTTFTVYIGGQIETMVPGSAFFHYRFSQGAFQTTALTPLGGHLFEVTLPAPGCGDTPEYYFSAMGSSSGPITLPRSAPTPSFTSIVGTETLVYAQVFDSDPGWTTEGLWAFGTPTGGGGDHGNPDPTSGYSGSNVYGYNLNGDYENNLVEKHLTSTAFDFSTMDNATLHFRRWLGVESPTYDHAMVKISTDGTNWTTIWENAGEITDSAWIPITLDLTPYVSQQAAVYLRWTIGPTDGSWIYCGWNIDDLEIRSFTCE